MSLAFHNGRFLPYSELVIPPHDAGFVFGATVTDFCRTYAHKLFRWPDHLARLRRDCDTCFIPLPYSDAEVTAAAETLVTENAKPLAPDDDLAVITFATPGPLGYMVGDPMNGPPTLAMHTFPIPKERYRRFFTEGVTLAFAGLAPQWGTVTAVPKHRSRMHWWHANQWINREPEPSLHPGAVSALWGRVNSLDTAIGAVLAVKDGTLRRSPTDLVLDSVSLGVVRELCEAVGIPFAIESREGFGMDFCNESEMLLAGSAFGVAGVRRFVWTRKTVEYAWPGPVFTKLVAAWSEMVGIDIVKQFTG